MRNKKLLLDTLEIINQHSKLECYFALKREYTVAEYLTTVTAPKLRKALTMYRLNEHSLATETGYGHTAHEMRWKLSCTS